MNETSFVKVSLVTLSFQRKVVNMKKIKPVLAILGLSALLFAVVLTMTSGIANAESATATRTLPAEPVPAGEFFTVRIEVSDYGIYGLVAETLPEGFCYLTSSLIPEWVTVVDVETNTVMFTLFGETSFTYTVKVPDTEGTYAFRGILKDMDKNEYEVGGDTEIEVEEAGDGVEPTATRTLPVEPVSAGTNFTIEIEALHYGYFGQVVETLPEGFCYTESTLNPERIEVEDNTIEFELWGEPSFTYTVKAPETKGIYTFTGILIDEDRNEYDIGGDTEIEIEEKAEPPFDTGSGAYPSIFGTHKGTIEPYQDITVHKLYTYPCAGTVGHSEYVKIWNETWSGVEATWTGYKGDDWHNISFDEPFILKEGEIYNYSIRTGSYPQIIHAKEFNATGGKITCTEFIDANDKDYDDWIPAIRLWA